MNKLETRRSFGGQCCNFMTDYSSVDVVKRERVQEMLPAISSNVVGASTIKSWNRMEE